MRASRSRIIARTFFLIGSCIFCSTFRASSDTAGLPELFRPATQSRDGSTSSVPYAKRSQPIQFNADAMRELRLVGSSTLQLTIFEMTYVITLEASPESTGGRSTWIGVVEGVPRSSVVAATSQESLFMNLWIPGSGVFEIRPSSETRYMARELDPAKFPPCGADDLDPLEVPSTPVSRGPAGADTCLDDGSTIDVLVVYTADAAGAAGDIEALIEMARSRTNTAYLISGVSTRINVVGTAQIDYTEPACGGSPSCSNVMFGHLKNIDGVIDEVHTLRDQFEADVVSMWTATLDNCGVAQTGVGPANQPIPASAFSVVRQDCAVSNNTFSHETGHVQGCGHQRDSPGINGAVFDYSYGFDGGSFNTIMSIFGEFFEINEFSNPDNGTGVPLSDLDNSAHNAMAINWSSETIAELRCSSFDCNTNLVDDEVDISNGTSVDCDLDGIPDECKAACDDGIVCNGDETCVAGTCFPGVSQCSSGQICALDIDSCLAECPPPGPFSCEPLGTPSSSCVEQLGGTCTQADSGFRSCAVATAPIEGVSIICTGNDTVHVVECPCTSPVPGELCRVANRSLACLDSALDCNSNLIDDELDIANGTSVDCDLDGIPDECKPACDDGIACNGIETCVAGTCVPGASQCSSGQLCALDIDSCLVECPPPGPFSCEPLGAPSSSCVEQLGGTCTQADSGFSSCAVATTTVEGVSIACPGNDTVHVVECPCTTPIPGELCRVANRSFVCRNGMVR